MEGIMMRGPKKTAMAVRNTKGEIVVEEMETKVAKRPAICRWPIIRGVFGFIDSMTLGYKCLMRSAELSGLEDLVEEDPKKKKRREKEVVQTTIDVGGRTVTAEACDEAEKAPAEDAEKKADEATGEKMPSWMMTVMMVVAVILALAIAIGLFFLAPSALFELISAHVPFLKGENAALNSLWKSVFEGVFKILLLVGYMAAVSLMKDIRRTFMYHGAEHKTIFCYEAGLELTVENIRKQRRFHPRCGTSFLILMLLVSIFVSFFIDPVSIALTGSTLALGWRTLVRFLMLPLVMGLGYELIKLAGRHDNLFTRIISMPGVWLQHITVFEPTDDMIECAIQAMTKVIPTDESDRW
ncbi:MAG: DUF1385 domain-containing protein [Clostridia bacterium]|nr:DUF1385 domain-containing protein [Clostridia bacterium]